MPKSLNPYVGPRSFQLDETLYGRDRELRQLTDRLLAERIVLLHSPSGAGKSSLMQAGLIPQLRAESFFVHPVIRVNLERPASLTELGQAFNRYIFSTLLSLEEHYPVGQRLEQSKLAGLGLDEYLNQRAQDDGRSDNPEFLIFDQFEEVLTVDPAERAAKNAFFGQLGVVLKNRNRWALFAMREDYLGALEPYVRVVPTYFANTYRLDLLGVNAAREAIQKPSRAAGVEFTDDAANKLVDDLRSTQIQLPDGTLESSLGLYVEPVQLQVVCYRLWETHPAGDVDITLDDLADVGDVDQSLAEYYAVSVEKAARQTGVSERSIREWFGRKLITPEGIRGQVLLGAESSDGLDNDAVRLLEDAHIIRGEKRAGATWFELAHDRLLEPVRKNNAEWFEKNLSLFQRQAALWIQQGRSDGLLLRGKEYLDAEKASRKINLTAIDQEYLAACKKLKAIEQREIRRNRLMSILAISATIALVTAIYFGLQAQQSALKNQTLYNEQNVIVVNLQSAVKTAVVSQINADSLATQAKQQARIARSKELAALSSAQGSFWVQRQLLLAISAYDILQPGDPLDSQTGNTLRSAVAKINSNVPLFGHQGSIRALAFSADGYLLASGGDDKIIRITDVRNLSAKAIELKAHSAAIRALQFSPDGKWLASAGDDGLIYLWDAQNFASPPKPPFGSRDGSPILALVFSPDSKTLVSGGQDTYIYYWKLSDLAGGPLLLQGQKSSITALAFMLDGSRFYSLSLDGKVYSWEPKAIFYNQALGGQEYTSSARGLTISSDRIFTNVPAASSESTTGLVVGVDEQEDYVILYDFTRDGYSDPYTPYRFLRGHENTVRCAAISPDGKLVASGGDEGIIRFWGTQPSGSIQNSEPYVLAVREFDFIYSFDFNPKTNQLLVGGNNTYLVLADSEKKEALPKPFDTTFDTTQSVIVSPYGIWAAASGNNSYDSYYYDDVYYYQQPQRYSEINLWRIANPTASVIVSKIASAGIAFSPDGKWLAYQEENNAINLYSLETGTKKISLPLQKSQILAIKFSPDSRWLVTSGWDKTIFLWDVNNPGAAYKTLEGNKSPIYSFEFSQDENWLLAGGTSGEFYAWRFDNIRSQELEPLQYSEQLCNDQAPGSVSIAIDDSHDNLAFACQNIIFFANIDNPKKMLGTLTTDDNITQIKFSPDHKYLVGSGVNGQIYYWDMDFKMVREKACAKLTRNFTQAEWGQFFPGEEYRVTCPLVGSDELLFPTYIPTP